MSSRYGAVSKLLQWAIRSLRTRRNVGTHIVFASGSTSMRAVTKHQSPSGPRGGAQVWAEYIRGYLSAVSDSVCVTAAPRLTSSPDPDDMAHSLTSPSTPTVASRGSTQTSAPALLRDWRAVATGATSQGNSDLFVKHWRHAKYLRDVSSGGDRSLISPETASLARRAWRAILEASNFTTPVPAACTGPDGEMFFGWTWPSSP